MMHFIEFQLHEAQQTLNGKAEEYSLCQQFFDGLVKNFKYIFKLFHKNIQKYNDQIFSVFSKILESRLSEEYKNIAFELLIAVILSTESSQSQSSHKSKEQFISLWQYSFNVKNFNL